MENFPDNRWQIASASDADLVVLRRMLVAEALPRQGVTDSPDVRFLVAREATGHVLGGIGLERAGRDALLRSLVVDSTRRGVGLGGLLVAAIESAARREGIDSLYLLTTTVPRFFARLGYRPIDRDQAPADLRQLDEFSTLCPASAACLVKQLQRTAQDGTTE